MSKPNRVSLKNTYHFWWLCWNNYRCTLIFHKCIAFFFVDKMQKINWKRNIYLNVNKVEAESFYLFFFFYLTKFTPGYVTAVLFFQGNVHKKALARRHAICNCEKLIDLLWFFFSNGIPLGNSSGRLRAKAIIFGNKCVKNWSDSSLSSSLKTHLFVE